MEHKQNRIWQLLFILYGITLLYLLFARKETVGELPYWELVQRQSSLIPFATIGRQLRHLVPGSRPWLIRYSLVNLAGNVLLFVPLGFFLPKFREGLRSFLKVLLVSGLLIIAIELTQVLTLVGRCDIDDLILNLLGVSVGYLLFRKNNQK